MMKLAYRVFVVSLFCLSLAIIAVAQTPRVSGTTTVSVDKSKRSAKDDRNTAPTFGTGGPMGGPTGLFTVYDGQTLRKGEFTFSAAYSNFDRDPGDADFTEVPVSFQVGVTNNFELFFNTDAYRAVKVNSPQNLSAFYLPNSRIGGISGGAMILAPSGPGTGFYEGTAVFRPAGTQPFVQYPYAGGSTGNFGFPFPMGQYFGFGVNDSPSIGGVVSGGGGADAFPGLGSTYGSILPGIVFRTVCTQSTLANCARGVIAPSSFTLAPSYLPDAPFINRTYAESAFSTYTAGAKFRFNDVNDWWGLAVVAGYRWYQDNANSVSGFNQLQRGASPGGKWNRGDILVTGAFDGRVRKWFNFSVNGGYHWNASVKSDLFGDDVTILDRPDELLLSAAADFPVNRYFQPIVEFRHTRYVGGRTPNAFENDPYEALAGVRIFPARWFGFSAGYRYHFNQQDKNAFNDDTVTLTSWAPCVDFGGTQPGGEGEGPFCNQAFIPVTTSYSGPPPGFRTSSDPHGFFFQAFIGRRNKRQDVVPNQPANVTALAVSDSTITLGCPPGTQPAEGAACNESTTVSVTTTAVDPENDILTYNYTVSGGRIVGSGANVSWDLSGAAPGTYTITAGVDDGCGLCGQTQTQTVTVAECASCKKICECPSLTVSGPSGITNPGDAMTFTANVSGGTQDSVTYNWTVSAGTITSGQGTPSISVDTTGLAGQSVTATVEIGGTDPTCGCPTTASETGGIAPLPDHVLVDEFGAMPNDDIRGRLDLFFAELSNNPNNQGYIINYGTPAQVATRERLIRNHIAFRRFDASRITLVNGGNTGAVSTKLYRVPPGANNPTP
ncbi:MAG TPA: hypothetical protein PLK77_14025 [Pyrinomonadaceae bacterium]|nr:hypothetical protein [Pyrinomonadaceae bacterium]